MSLKDLYVTPGHLIRRAQQIAVACFMEECAEMDLTPVQYAAMLAIQEHPGIDAARLSGMIAFDRGTICDVIRRLGIKGLVSREHTPDDQRIKLITLTAEGKRTLKRADNSVKRAQDRILEPLNPADRNKLVELLEKVVKVNNEVSRAPLRPLEKISANKSA